MRVSTRVVLEQFGAVSADWYEGRYYGGTSSLAAHREGQSSCIFLRPKGFKMKYGLYIPLTNNIPRIKVKITSRRAAARKQGISAQYYRPFSPSLQAKVSECSFNENITEWLDVIVGEEASAIESSEI